MTLVHTNAPHTWSTGRRTAYNNVWLAALLVASALLSTPAVAQGRVYGPAGRPPRRTLDSLIRALPESLQERARTMVESDSVDARALAGNRLADRPEATTFLFNVVPYDPAPKVREYSIMNVYAYPHMHGNPFVRSTLEWMAVEDPDTAIAKRAFNMLRAFSIRPIRQLADERMKHARTLGDSAVAATAGLEEAWITADHGWMLPSYLRAAPPVFSASPPRRPIRVLAFGDFGTGAPSQLEAAAAMRAYHAKHRFTFGVTLGDNFYPEGVDSPQDPRWRTQYEALYSPMGVKIYASLGNHDEYNGETPLAEMLYAFQSPTWRMPAQNYTFTAGPAQFWAIDGADMTEAQLRWLRASLEKSQARWKIVYGHYPLYSSTDRGGQDGHLAGKLLPVLQGRANVYVAGHHHSMQHLKPIGTLNLIVAGSGGAGNYGVDEQDPRVLFARSTHGFSVLEVTEKALTLRFVDTKGKELYAATIPR